MEKEIVVNTIEELKKAIEKNRDYKININLEITEKEKGGKTDAGKIQ